MTSAKSDRAVANQYIIRADDMIIFQSYDSTIAVLDKDTGRLTLGIDFDYSRTTAKYLHRFIDLYCPGSLTQCIDSAPGNSFITKLKWCIKHRIIKYNEGMV